MTNSTNSSKTTGNNNTGSIFSLLPDNTQHLASLQGQLDGNLRIIEQRLQLTISNRGNRFHIAGSPAACITGENVLQQLYREAQQNSEVTPEMVHLALVEALQTMTEKLTSHKTLGLAFVQNAPRVNLVAIPSKATIALSVSMTLTLALGLQALAKPTLLSLVP